MAIESDIGAVLSGFGRFFLNPVFYLFLLFIYLHYRRQMLLERQLFAVRIQHPLEQTVRSLGMGIVGGLLISVLAAALGIVIQLQDLWLLWGLAAILALIRLRYLCFAYAAGLLTLFHAAAKLLPDLTHTPGIGSLWSLFIQAKPLPLLGLVAVMHLIEAFLVRWNRGRDASPMFVEGQRGRIVGAYLLHSFWVTPLALFVPVEAGAFGGELYAGWPFFGTEAAAYGLLLLPSVTGFSALTQTEIPARKAGHISRQLTFYALLLLGLTALAVWWPPLILLAALFALIGHEGLFWLGEWQERQKAPAFIQSSRGVKVMAVLPGTPAEEMGVRIGEVIVRVNGQAVRNKEDLYPALQANPAFCKMEVLTLEGELKFVQCAVYAGNHHQLGIIVVPDATTRVFVDMRQASVMQLVKEKLEKLNLGA
ncbi:PDZ domain-containing protein [Brevibacillus composti]|uniref:PDZ domain-containing protein n=1 Tax=Brevibacillus composti TaxID=2796470 RepID=A0A7T5JNJ2_9BACL|nr:PDZ domain-containing protein [Brevibacillus composti]QQE74070.1 PDZ domain-containing protein [Brevibacillus composti]QUO41154.1 PDZ domain-containing protein [Brevibacillus composti]